MNSGSVGITKGESEGWSHSGAASAGGALVAGPMGDGSIRSREVVGVRSRLCVSVTGKGLRANESKRKLGVSVTDTWPRADGLRLLLVVSGIEDPQAEAPND